MKTQCSHAHAMPARLEGRALKQALAAADKACAELSEWFTPPRRRVLELLLTSGAPNKAYDLIGAYHGDGRAVSPTTVYRSLEFLERMGFVHRLESINAYIACPPERRGHAAGFLICECCGGAEAFEPDLRSERAAATSAGFKINRVTFEAQGVCRNCRQGEPSPTP
ncbi:Fur family transcriptional regulator [Phenylobacterium sp.]|uniref:Fur family transcriptional regulator n=1 Tax=Phenylobacterium sp. TaxID=1871053 RepID=UPI002C2345D5|nr:Fur family transcriptional regulator [Phenylobacterium sp.]HLZ74851.1 Fur family transcriptional regulator [Phenylobacterium sp.]